MSTMSPFLTPLNLKYIEELQSRYQEKPESLDPTWRYFFEGMQFAEEFSGSTETVSAPDDLEFELKVIELIQAYREMAYVIADVNPLDRRLKTHPLLDLNNFGLKDSDRDRTSHAARLLGMSSSSVKEIIAVLRSCYAGPASVELEHIEDPKIRLWVQKRMEGRSLSKPFEAKIQKHIWEKLFEAESLDLFLHKRFIGQKRFSAEGCDVLTPMMDFLVDQSSLLGTDEIIIGMAHRGRLSILANIFHMNLHLLFAQFSGNVEAEITAGDGDVKYHIGASEDTTSFSGKPVHLSLVPNPSHLEAVNPVVMGMTHAKQKQKKDLNFERTLSVLIHGDAAFSGQGVVYECLNMSGISGYSIGGTIHIILNNQVGFTANPHEARSTNNPTDLAKMLQVPIFRVNADEPEAALRTIELAVQFRHEFKRDVFIEVFGYRRFGHNESDEPEFTQPVLYTKIKNHPTVLHQYTDKLKTSGVISDADVKAHEKTLNEKFETNLDEAKKNKVSSKLEMFGKKWKGLQNVPQDDSILDAVETAVSQKTLVDLGTQTLTVPEGFHLHRKLKRLFDERAEMLAGKKPLDWGMGECLAYASLIHDGFRVRLSGQDSKRGTFSHRHAVLLDSETGQSHTPLNALKGHEGCFEVLSSLLSEYAVMGFEFGESLSAPNQLTLWEAQFGDFANGAQIIIDQFITGSAFKWQRYSGLTLLLPHGYEGQGPEHSSARMERFLLACALNNIQVCNVTTPAQLFHLLRRQMLKTYRLPLILMTPKSLLRHPMAVSGLAEFSSGEFQHVLDDPDTSLNKSAKHVLMCSGKVYYELLQERDRKKLKLPILRMEQFYPFPHRDLSQIFKHYKKLEMITWCQEEPENMGGWWYMQRNLPGALPKNVGLTYAGRSLHPSPAMGYMHMHGKQQQHVIEKALENLSQVNL